MVCKADCGIEDYFIRMISVRYAEIDLIEIETCQLFSIQQRFNYKWQLTSKLIFRFFDCGYVKGQSNCRMRID